VLILLTNDDGIYAPGLAAMAQEMRHLGEVVVVAPATEQSGVGHSITYLTPLIVKEVFHHDVTDGEKRLGWAVEGSPADCVKLGIHQFCARPPNLVVSGINSGANVGINVLYSGTVAAAIEGAFFKVTSVAVSLEIDEQPDYVTGARLARQLVEQLVARRPPAGSLYSVNLPAFHRGWPKGIRVVPMGLDRHGERFERRTDPRGRTYYWITSERVEPEKFAETDVSSLREGYVTITPLNFDLSRFDNLRDMAEWTWRMPERERIDG